MEIFTETTIPKIISIDLAHLPEHACPEGEWDEVDHNYRLNLCDEIIYATENLGVIGHLGIQDSHIKAVFVNEDSRNQGVAIAMYIFALTINPLLYSDDGDAREASATNIWKILQKRYPKQITYNSKSDIFCFKK